MEMESCLNNRRKKVKLGIRVDFFVMREIAQEIVSGVLIKSCNCSTDNRKSSSDSFFTTWILHSIPSLVFPTVQGNRIERDAQSVSSVNRSPELVNDTVQREVSTTNTEILSWKGVRPKTGAFFALVTSSKNLL